VSRRAERVRQQRRGAPIHAYVGENGGGKSLAMVYDTIPSLGMRWECDHADHLHTAAGVTSGLRRVLSTVRMVDPVTGDPHPQYEALTSWAQLLAFEHGDVLLDEVQGVASSRQSMGLPPAVLNLFLQMRRRDVVLRLSTPSYARADVVLREVCQAVTYCRGYRPEPQEGRLWGANRWFLWRTYDALQFDEFSAGKREQLKPLTRQLYRRLADPDRAQEWYRTLDAVDYIADATEAGTCLQCGGTRRRPTCSCDKHRRGAPARGSDGASLEVVGS
jgi:hypothetical protein